MNSDRFAAPQIRYQTANDPRERGLVVGHATINDRVRQKFEARVPTKIEVVDFLLLKKGHDRVDAG
jgi:hypothetical protein